MRTSANQFEMMITFMEQYGDLSKPSTLPKGKVVLIQRWEELTDKLNSDATGDTKTTEKWKKVWSDFKNNTKRKAAKIHRFANGTGGGPPVHCKLTDLEKRALAIVGKQAATGLTGVNEAGIIEESMNLRNCTQPEECVQVSTPEPLINDENIIEEFVITPQLPIAAPSDMDAMMQSMQDNRVPTPSTSGHTPRRRLLGRGANASRRRMRNHAQLAAQQFVNSDEEWRRLKMEQLQYKMEREREQIRLRELELQVQREWMALGLRAIETIEKYLTK